MPSPARPRSMTRLALALSRPAAGHGAGARPARGSGSNLARPTATAAGYGTLGYGGYGLYPGFLGFGLSFHLGYGYGGRAWALAAHGGYPFYGGRGYPHGEPILKRFGNITRFPITADPAIPSMAIPTTSKASAARRRSTGRLGVRRRLASRQPCRRLRPLYRGYSLSRDLFAPYAAAAAATGSSTGPSSSASATSPAGTRSAAGLSLNSRAIGLDQRAIR